MQTPPAIYIVSGSTGASGTQLVRTALAQFSTDDVIVHIVPQVRTTAQMDRVVARAAADKGIIVHTLVDQQLRGYLIEEAESRRVTAVDLMGGLLDQLVARLNQQPLSQPGRYRVLHEQDLKRIDAIRYAVEHDDGKRAYELDKADIVLTGISRVGKTPIGVYLATMGWKVANVPLARNVNPPGQLFEIHRGRVIGLTAELDRLVMYRQHRGRDLGLKAGTSYTDPKALVMEMEYAYEIFRKGHFSTIDTTDRSIEENADESITLITRRFG